MNKEIESCIKYSISKNSNIFLSILDKIEAYYTKPCNNILELKKRSTKSKGDLFEHFCVLYLKAQNYDEIWLIKDTPREVLNLLNLKSFDIGIDIVAKKNDKFYAIQAKYRKLSNNKKYSVLGWKDLSTFYAYCARTGPWEKYIVMTTCDYVRRLGMKNEKDMTIAKKSFMNTNKEIWLKMIDKKENITDTIEVVTPKINNEEIRNKRADYFENLLNKKTTNISLLPSLK